jgi:hypothetical protein
MVMVIASYPTSGTDWNEATKAIWYEMLKNVPYDTALNNLRMHVMSSRFPPAICDIIGKPERMGAGEAWNEVYKLILRYGVNREEEALNDMSPEVKAAVKAVGYHTICMSSETESKKMFTQAYKETKEKSYALV